MLEIGRYNDLIIEKEVEFGVYLNSEEGEILLPKKYVPKNVSPGDTLEVFVYTDSEDRLVATTETPFGVVGDFVFLEVKDVVPFGTFMGWGLEKDLLVPKSEQRERMVPGEKYLTKICFDEMTDRVYGSTKISMHCDTNIEELKEGQEVDLLIHYFTKIGIMAVVDNRYYGMLYINETYQDLSVGDSCRGYIMRLREDKKIDLTLKKPGYGSVQASSDVILNTLEKAGGFIPCHDKSPPEEIKNVFSMSKKEFKRSVGGLFKKGLIELGKDGIKLK